MYKYDPISVFCATIMMVLVIVAIGGVSNNVGKTTIVNSCQDFGAFSHNGTIYECKPKAKIQ